MNINLKSLELQSFRSFSQPQVFEFGGEAGVYSVVGDNKAEPDLGANGAGKTSVWEGLYWTLFGTGIPRPEGLTPRGPSLECRYSDLPMRTTLNLEANGLPLAITRNYKPGSITIDDGSGAKPEVVSQQSMEMKLGITQPFTQHGLFLGQGATSFLDLGPAEKLKFIDSLNESLRWDDYRKEATEAKKSLESSFHMKESKLETLLQQIEEKDSEIEELERRSATHKEEIQLEIDAKQEIISKKKSALDLSQSKLEGLEDSYDKTVDAISLLEEKFPPVAQEVEDLEAVYQAQRDEVGRLRMRLEFHETQLEKLSRLKAEGMCPKCGQKLSKTHERKVREESEQAIREAKEEKAREQEILASMETDLEKAQNSMEAMKEKKRGLEYERNGLETQIRYEKRFTQETLSSIAELESSLKKLHVKYNTNPFRELADQKVEEVKILRKEYKEQKEKCDKLQHEINLAAWWVSGFHELKLFRVSKIISHLEISFNNALLELGMSGYHISLAVEKETKSKTVSQKFHVSVKSPDYDIELPWESFSGGELQRLRLACACGMFDLISNLSGTHWNVEVYDEPTQHLSETGTESLLNLFQRRAETHGKEVWLVDHHRISYGSFKDLRKVTKYKDGSIIENGQEQRV